MEGFRFVNRTAPIRALLLLLGVVSLVGMPYVVLMPIFADRILGGGALRGGMPLWKYVSNRFLTLAENVLIGAKLSEYHTGYRAYSRDLLERLPLQRNSDDFVFDNQVLAQIIALGCAIGEVTCPARYMPEASSINFRRSLRYGLGCLATALRFRLARWKLVEPTV